MMDGTPIADSTPWRLEIASPPGRAWVVIGMAWAFLGLCYLLFKYAEADGSMEWMTLVVLPWVAIVTYYALRTARGERGMVRIDEQGFTVVDGPKAERRYAWPDVERFQLGKLGANPVHPGVDVPRIVVRQADGKTRIDGLPGSTGIPAGDFVAMMETLRRLAGAAWPQRPGTIQEARRLARDGLS